MRILGLAYKKGVGKNTLAKFISTFIRCEAPQINVKEISFAAKLKDVAYQLYGWAGMKRGIYYEVKREEKEIILPQLNKTPRQIWIEVGNKMREVYPKTWIDFALNGVKSDILIITDVRFCNEALAIKQAGGRLVRIIRDNIPQGTDPAEVDLDAWNSWDNVVHNCGSLQDLNKEAEFLAKDLIYDYKQSKTS